MRVLLVGPLRPLGGATVLFSQLVQELRQVDGVSIEVIDTGRQGRGHLDNLRQALRVVLLLVRNVVRCDVVAFHASPRGALQFAPVVSAICRLAGRPWAFRGFGGSFNEWYRRAGGLRRWIFRRTLLGADAILLETKASVEFFRPLTSRPIHWYANSRPSVSTARTLQQSEARSDAVRLIYLGHVCREKGVLDLVEAARQVTNVSIDVFGPLTGDFGSEAVAGPSVTYRGVVPSSAIPELLRQYRGLVLPTKWENEGYPGVILEAYQCGLPVIATAWRSIPEIVDERSGVLVAPGSPDALAAAIQRFADSPALQRSLSEGARDRAVEFDSVSWTRRFVEICTGVVGKEQVCPQPC